VFSNPVKIPQWILPQILELKEFSSLPVPIYTLSLCPPSRVSSSRTSNSFVLLCTYAPSQCPPGRALRIFSDYCFFLNSQQSSSRCTTMHMLNAHLAELHITHSKVLSATVSLLHSLASKVFNNLEVFL
jgi:hypothetical protein